WRATGRCGERQLEPGEIPNPAGCGPDNPRVDPHSVDDGQLWFRNGGVLPVVAAGIALGGDGSFASGSDLLRRRVGRVRTFGDGAVERGALVHLAPPSTWPTTRVAAMAAQYRRGNVVRDPLPRGSLDSVSQLIRRAGCGASNVRTDIATSGNEIRMNYSNQGDDMLKKLLSVTFAAAVVVLVLPSVVSAYGAAHVGYTHVGPNGVYHTGETVARGPGGTYAT